MTPRTMNTIGVVNTALSPAAQVEAYAITVKVQCAACVLLSLLPEKLVASAAAARVGIDFFPIGFCSPVIFLLGCRL